MEIRTQPMVAQRQEESAAPQEVAHSEHHSAHMEAACKDGRCGHLPACAPLANPYVPFQCNNPPTYPAKNGVTRGTLFPGLDLPFHGLVNENPLSDTPLHELQTLGFALVELGEYLDTHPDDKDAFSLFRSYAELYRKGRKEYEAKFGPLTQSAAAESDQYNWLKDPWPWDYAANQAKEG